MADGSANMGGLVLAQPRVYDFALLAGAMRPDEIRQWLALTGMDEYDPDLAARGFIAIPGPRWMLAHDGMPLVIGGFEPVRAGVGQCWMLGSMDGWGSHWRAITKWSRRLVTRALRQGWAHRIEVVALAERTEAHEWYVRGMGMAYEGRLRGWFADGSDAMIFARVRGDHRDGREWR